ncbi:MAG: glycosyltransferase family 4 protein [Prevotellaceae bacterium]|jgi:glycosyltransferase involved in cell wall biosynthesis|nr:glycosyltransferase family 4 protein [Prevotellaceae bacterium]
MNIINKSHSLSPSGGLGAKRVLIITYYWVPSGGSGVQRWLKFAKYFRDFGWEPVIYAPENPDYPTIDTSFEKDLPENLTVIKTPIWEPYNIYRSLTGGKNKAISAGFISEGKKSGWKDKLSIWIRGNFLIPDPRRFWIKPSVKFLKKYLAEHPVDAIVTTGPPHSMHLIGLKLKRLFPATPWIADFRDPWTNIHYHKDLHLTPLADNIHHRMEKAVVQTADCLTVTSQGTKEEFELLHPQQIEVITNGFDDSDFGNENVSLDPQFTISHIGLLTEKQNPTLLWKVLKEMCDADETFRKDLKIQLIGKTDAAVVSAIEQCGLQQQLSNCAYVPHKQAIERLMSSQLLLLLLLNQTTAKGILHGKIFEYLAAKRPIVAFGTHDSDIARVIRETKSGITIDYNAESETKQAITDLYARYKNNTLHLKSEAVEQYSRRKLTEKYAALLESL